MSWRSVLPLMVCLTISSASPPSTSLSIPSPSPSPPRVDVPVEDPLPASPQSDFRRPRVLIYSPTFGHWHATFLARMADLLQENNYDATVLSPLMMPDVLTGPLVARRIDIPTHPLTAEQVYQSQKATLQKLWTKTDPYAAAKDIFGPDARSANFSTMFAAQCNMTLSRDSVMKELREANFDLAITELFDLCGLGLFHELGIDRVALVSTVPVHEFFMVRLGLPSLTSSVISSLAPNVPADHIDWTLSDVVLNWAQSMIIARDLFAPLLAKQEAIFRARDPNFPGLETLMRRAAALFANSHPLLHFNDPTLPNFVPIGGFGVTRHPKPLPKEFGPLFALRRHTVLVSFGTFFKATSMPSGHLRKLLYTLGSLPDVTFFLKHENSTLIEQVHGIPIPPNVLIFDWLPQSDLLGDPRLSLFITHGGIGSTMEAAFRGCPTLVIPIMFDQPRNALMMARHGSARMVRKEVVFEDYKHDFSLQAVIIKMLVDKSYKKAAVTLADRLAKYEDPNKILLRRINYIVSVPASYEWRNFDGRIPHQTLLSLMVPEVLSSLASHYPLSIGFSLLCLSVYLLLSLFHLLFLRLPLASLAAIRRLIRV